MFQIYNDWMFKIRHKKRWGFSAVILCALIIGYEMSNDSLRIVALEYPGKVTLKLYGSDRNIHKFLDAHKDSHPFVGISIIFGEEKYHRVMKKDVLFANVDNCQDIKTCKLIVMGREDFLRDIIHINDTAIDPNVTEEVALHARPLN